MTLKLEKKELVLTELTICRPFFAKKIRQHRSRKEDYFRDIIYIHEDSPSQDLINGFIEASTSYADAFISSALSHVRNVYFLPASRSGLYQALNAFSQIVAELSKSRAFLTRKIELPGISEPLSDYFLKLSEITTATKDESAFSAIAESMEKEILRGKVEFDNRSKKLTYQPNGANFKLDLSTTSSMVSELSPIVSFLRYVLPDERVFGQPYTVVATRRRRQRFPLAKPLIVIEEPEAHLHPRVQLRLVAIFSELLKAKAKLVVTTHSNYLFTEVSNKVLSGDIDAMSTNAIQLVSTPEGSKAAGLHVDNLGIEDRNFGEVSEDLLNERIATIQKKNNESIRQD